MLSDIGWILLVAFLMVWSQIALVNSIVLKEVKLRVLLSVFAFVLMSIAVGVIYASV